MKLPAVDDLIGKQWTVYDSAPDKPLFVAGPPGSGKTSLAVLRAQFLSGPEFNQTVVLVTKNRMLAALAKELGSAQFDTVTMNSLVAGDYRRRFNENVPGFSSFLYEWEAILDDYASLNVEPLFDHMVIDEGQNLPIGFYSWASKYGARVLTVFADEDQATHPERSSLSDIANATGLSDPVRLTDNHRNTPEIAAVAEHFHVSQILPPAVVQRPAGGETPRLIRINSIDDLPKRVATRYANRGESIGVIVFRKQDAHQMHSRLNKLLPTERVDVYTSEANKGVESSIRLLEQGVTILTGEAVIGLEFGVVYLLDLRRSLPCRSTGDQRRLYMLCARARDALFLIDYPAYLGHEQLAALPSPPVLIR
ncbi:AAA family ATPase [Melittangium boletus]|uniref:DNA 3'-5' helicase II n=1 Tax=Melittangium boletus DSM 14713 TaxID=1294270 RepID=A0A250IM46_9BACT|nr:AAA family ATPase [Melittangium boletus]ATB32292.1 hypothetical protein MEBOL_005769 [Melittangium boletus DSM 14713]